MEKKVLSILVDNTSGVLSRVSGLFSRRGYSIDSLTVGKTENQEFSRMTVVVCGEDQVLEQIEKQVAKLEDVRCVKVLTHGHRVCRELILATVAFAPNKRVELISIVGSDGFRGKIVDISLDTMMIELTGNSGKIDAFIKLINEDDSYEIKELVRTGVAGLGRSEEDMFDMEDFD